MIDKVSAPDAATLRKLTLRGFDVVSARTKNEAMDWMDRSEFDCILITVARESITDFADLAEIRKLSKTSALVLMTEGSTTPLIEEALVDGRIELSHASSLVMKITALSKPALIVCARLNLALIQALRNAGLQVRVANTLQFALVLLEGRGTQIAILRLHIPGMRDDNDWVIFRRINLELLAVLAAALPDTPSRVVHWTKPQNASQFIELFDHVAGICPSPCGLAEQFGNRGTTQTEAC